MITRSMLIAWGLAASQLASRGQRKLSSTVLEGMADAALANPIASTDDGVRATMAFEVAIAWFEGANDPRAIGDGHASYCWGQVYLPNGARTLEGWTGPELVADAAKCAAVVVRLVKASALASPKCALCELTVYARGRDCPQGRSLSRNRVALAHKLATTIPLPEVK